MAGANRKRAEARGRRAETFAALILRLKGYCVLASRQKTRSGEIDLVCRKKGVMVMVEVKLRPDIEAGRSAVPDSSWIRIARAADLWLGGRGEAYFNADRRYDLFIVTPGFHFCHIPDAWRPDYPLTPG